MLWTSEKFRKHPPHTHSASPPMTGPPPSPASSPPPPSPATPHSPTSHAPFVTARARHDATRGRPGPLPLLSPRPCPMRRSSKTPVHAASSTATARARLWPCPLGRCRSSSPQGAPFACAQEDPPLLFAPLLQALLHGIQEVLEKVSCKPLLLSDPISSNSLHLGSSRMLSPHGQILVGAYIYFEFLCILKS